MPLDGFAFQTSDGGLKTVEYIATNITPPPIPDSFEPEMYLYPEPEAVASMDETFGNNSGYEFELEFMKYYDQEGKVWTTDDLLIVTEPTRIEVAAHQALLDAYDEDYAEWLREKGIQREIQWRVKVAKRLMEWATAHES